MKKSAEVDTDDSVQVVNLVDGKSAMIESVDGSFEAFEIHYAETAIIPAGTGTFKITPNDGEIKLIAAKVRR